MAHCCSTDLIDERAALNTKLRRILWAALAINAVMFCVEASAGLYAHSNALLADSLDMLSDASVYAISLFVLSRGTRAKADASLVKGALMLALGLLVVGESLYKVFNPVHPAGEIITAVGVLALIANLACAYLLLRHRSTDINIRSAWICSRNDVVANIGVIIAGVLVLTLGSMWPDIAIGFAIAALIVYSSVGVIRESLAERRAHTHED